MFVSLLRRKEECMFQFPKRNTKRSSRSQIQIKEVRDNVLILSQNTYCLILETSSINFELKSEAEQDVLIDSFQNFLNALPCKLQVLIRVRELEVEQYLEQLSLNGKQEKETVYKDQLNHYKDFMKKLISGSKILSRRFYIVLSYQPTDTSDFSLIKEQLLVNHDIVMKGFEKMGMKVRLLDSLELLHIFYSFYNQTQSKIQPLTKETIQQLTNYGNAI